MRLAFIFNYPLVDNVDWKKKAILELLTLGHEVDVYYGKTDFKEYLLAYLKRRKHHNTKLVSKNLAKKTKKNIAFFKEKGIEVHKIKNYNTTKAISKIAASNYDYIISAIDQILVKRFIRGVNTKVLNVHYARLPEIKGMNAIEWNFLVNRKCELTLHYINEGIDTGRIIKIAEIKIDDEDCFFSMREKIQNKIPEVIVDFVEGNMTDTMPNKGGKLYTYMHWEIKKLLKN